MSSALSPFGVAFAGAVSGVVSNAAIYPLDTVKTRIQTDQSSSTTTADGSLPSSLNRPGAPSRLSPRKQITARAMIARILKQQGLAGFYRGFGASMLNTFSMQFAYFYWYTIVRRTWITKFAKSASLNTATELSLGALAAAFAQMFTIPVSVIATRQQTDDQATSFISTLKAVLDDDGITGLWRGLKSATIKDGQKMTPGRAFILGAISKALATIVTYPYIMAKTRLQAKYNDPNETVANKPTAVSGQRVKRKERYTGAIDCLTQVYKKDGLAGWYQGMQAQITKATLAQALLFGIKDGVESYVVLFLIWWAKTSGVPIGVAAKPE